MGKHIEKTCSICLKTMHSNNLKRHMKTHKDEKQQRQEAGQIHYNTEISGRNYEL